MVKRIVNAAGNLYRVSGEKHIASLSSYLHGGGAVAVGDYMHRHRVALMRQKTAVIIHRF
jgi:hypothetical protein